MPVVVLYGENDFLLEQEIKALRRRVVDPAMAGLCHKLLKNPGFAALQEAIGGLSMALGGQTLIEIRQFAWLSQSPKDAAADADLERLKQLLETVEPTKTIAFVSEKLDGRLKFPKWLTQNKSFTVVPCKPLAFWEANKAARFAQDYAKSQGGQLRPDAADLLTQAVGVDMRLLAGEVDKLLLIAPDRPVTLDDVRRVAPQSDNLFLLINRWILREAPATNYGDLSEILLKRHPVEIFATVQSYFGNIFRVLWLSHHGWSPDRIAQETGQKPFTVKKHLSQFGRVPLQRLTHLKGRLLEAEWKTKTGQSDGTMALEAMLGA